MKKFILVVLSAIYFIFPLVAYAANQPKGFPTRVTGRVVDGHYEEYSIYPWSIEYDEESGKMTLLYQVETAYDMEPIFLYLVTINSKEKTLYIHRNWRSENHIELDFIEADVLKHELTYEEKSGFDLAFKKALPLWKYRQKIERQGQGKTL